MAEIKLIALLGSPIGHSISPRMQNAAYEIIGYNGYYELIETDGELLGNNVANIRRDPAFAGFACSAPCKELIVPYLDELRGVAKKMRTVNTVVKESDGRLIGYNTDAYGAICSFEKEKIDISKNIFMIWGAGGAGRSISFALAENGCKRIYIVDVKEHDLDQQINDTFEEEIAIKVPAGDRTGVAASVKASDVLCNLSGVGMKKSLGQTIVDPQLIEPRHICFESAYAPAKTQFFVDAETKGCKVFNGLDMLVYQGAKQIELWTGLKAPVEEMHKLAEEINWGV